jgi:hypothetical protein
MSGYGYNPRALFQPFGMTIDITSGQTVASASTTIVAAKAGYTPFITFIHFEPTVGGATTVSVTDTSSSAETFWQSTSSPVAASDYESNWGEMGLQCNEGYGLKMDISTTSKITGHLTIQGYIKRTATVALSGL